MDKVEEMLQELRDRNAIEANAQTVVLVVREKIEGPFSTF
jgi:hypothetical protein